MLRLEVIDMWHCLESSLPQAPVGFRRGFRELKQYPVARMSVGEGYARFLWTFLRDCEMHSFSLIIGPQQAKILHGHVGRVVEVYDMTPIHDITSVGSAVTPSLDGIDLFRTYPLIYNAI